MAGRIRDHVRDGEPNLFLRRLRERFTDEQIETFLEILDTTCPFCWDEDDGCACANDD